MKGCFQGLLPKITTGHKRAARVVVRSYSEKTEQDVTPSPSSEVTLKDPFVGNAPASGSCFCCGSFKQSEKALRPNVDPPIHSSEDMGSLIGSDVLQTIDSTIHGLKEDLCKLSMDMCEHPEVGFEEHHAHRELTGFIEKYGFTVTKHYSGLETAWRAEYTHGTGGRVIGLQSEMDALPRLGHACGHNLIAISGIAIAIAMKAAMEKHKIAGKIILLGTPAEEHGGGKIKLLEQGAYKEMDVCIMCHPGPGPEGSTTVQPWTAVQNIEVAYKGKTAHAAYAPWEARNALDAAVLAYNSVSALRQQVKPTYRIHGVIDAQPDWEPNVIPGYSKMRWAVRAPTWDELVEVRDRVIACLDAAGKATSCNVEVTLGIGYKDCRENSALAEEYVRVVRTWHRRRADISSETLQASTDLGDVSYELPCIEPVYAIPTKTGGKNHTAQFADSAKEPEAHTATLDTAKCLAVTALRVLRDDDLYQQVSDAFEAQRQKVTTKAVTEPISKLEKEA